jgi:hypothetical protein
MPTKDEVIKEHGKEMWDLMCKTGWLDGITCTMNPDGTVEIPQSDIDRALRSAKGKYVGAEEMD